MSIDPASNTDASVDNQSGTATKFSQDGGTETITQIGVTR